MPMRGAKATCNPFPPYRRMYLGYAVVRIVLFFLGECGGAGAFSGGVGWRCAHAGCRFCAGSVGIVSGNLDEELGDIVVLDCGGGG